MLPPAPGLFSITTDWPQTSCRRLPTRRAVISVEPAGANGTTIRTDFVGQSAAREARETRIDGDATVAAATPTKRRRFSMDALPSGSDRPIASGHDVFLRSLRTGRDKINAAKRARANKRKPASI